MKKRYKISLVFGLLALFLLFGYFFRLDRFGLTSIHWEDFIEYKDELYIAVTSSDGTHITVNESEIGDKIGEVKYTLQGNVRNTHYRYRNFDASFLKKGTQIYRMKDKKLNNHLTIYMDGVYYLYQVRS